MKTVLIIFVSLFLAGFALAGPSDQTSSTQESSSPANQTQGTDDTGLGSTSSNEVDTAAVQFEDPGRPLSDKEMEVFVKENLQKASLYKPSDFRIKARSGKITLSGTGVSDEDARTIVSLVERMPQVKEVVSRLGSAELQDSDSDEPDQQDDED